MYSAPDNQGWKLDCNEAPTFRWLPRHNHLSPAVCSLTTWSSRWLNYLNFRQSSYLLLRVKALDTVMTCAVHIWSLFTADSTFPSFLITTGTQVDGRGISGNNSLKTEVKRILSDPPLERPCLLTQGLLAGDKKCPITGIHKIYGKKIVPIWPPIQIHDPLISDISCLLWVTMWQTRAPLKEFQTPLFFSFKWLWEVWESLSRCFQMSAPLWRPAAHFYCKNAHESAKVFTFSSCRSPGGMGQVSPVRT